VNNFVNYHSNINVKLNIFIFYHYRRFNSDCIENEAKWYSYNGRVSPGYWSYYKLQYEYYNSIGATEQANAGKWTTKYEIEDVTQELIRLKSNVSQSTQAMNKCISRFSSYFGQKSGSEYSCGGNYVCQATTGTVQAIGVDRNLADNSFYYYWGGWSKLSLGYCQ
jgi:hypothetical protein